MNPSLSLITFFALFICPTHFSFGSVDGPQLIKRSKLPGSNIKFFLYEEKIHVDYWINQLSSSILGQASIRAKRRSTNLIGKVVYLELNNEPIYLLVKEITVQTTQRGSSYGRITDLKGDLVNVNGSYIIKNIISRKNNEITVSLENIKSIPVISRALLIHNKCSLMFWQK